MVQSDFLQWNDDGVLPPVDPADQISYPRSPYLISMTDFVSRFGISQERCQLLTGFLRYRSALHNAGFTRGFQWVDGSFTEHKERLKKCPPNDIDLITFYCMPDGLTQQNIDPGVARLFEAPYIKKTFNVHEYAFELKTSDPELWIDRATYWYSVWSHRRDNVWKGYIRVDLAPIDEAAAQARLDVLIQELSDV